MNRVTAVDVSFCQTNVDYNKVKADGIDTVIIRAGFGRETYQKDAQFEEHYRKAKAAGLKVGVYWFSYAYSVAEAKKEASACLYCLNGRKLDLPVFYDLELGSQTKLGKDTLSAMAVAFCECVKVHGYSAGVYASASWFTSYLNYDKLKKQHAIWLAQWSTSSPCRTCDIWQNSDRGKINGISGNVDTDIIYNTGYKGSSSTTKVTTNTQKYSGVKAVQAWVGTTVDGIYGSDTKKHLVMKLQEELNRQFGMNLVVDGIYGVGTHNAIVVISKGCRGNITKVLQGLLICNGYDPNGFDGIYGNGTEYAVKSYQHAHGLTADGIAGGNTFRSLCA